MEPIFKKNLKINNKNRKKNGKGNSEVQNRDAQTKKVCAK